MPALNRGSVEINQKAGNQEDGKGMEVPIIEVKLLGSMDRCSMKFSEAASIQDFPVYIF